MMEQEWVKPIVFRRRLAISTTTFRKAVRHGRIDVKESDGEALVEWHSNRKSFVESCANPQRYEESEIERRRKAKLERRKAKKSPPVSGEVPKTAGDAEDPVDDEFTDNMNKRKAEAIKQTYLAKQAKLKFLKDVGKLVEIEQVKKEWEEIAIFLRKQFLGIPDRCSELIASIEDPREINNILNKEISHVLLGLKYELKIDGKNVEDKVEEKEKSIPV